MTDGRENRSWIGRGIWAVADQGIFALGSAVLNILLARWLSPTEYGAFAIAYSLFLFVGVFHTALVTEPLLVFGADKYASRTNNYLAILLQGHWAIAGVGCLVLIVAGMILTFTTTPLAGAILGTALATPFSLLLWFARRAAYLRSQSRLAAVASVNYLVLLLVGLYALASVGAVSVFSVMTVSSMAGGLSGLWLLRRVHRLKENRVGDKMTLTPRAVTADHWHYGRWAIGTGLLMWVPLNFFFVVLSTVNLEASATLKALSSLVLPLLQANAALGALLLPAMASRARSRQHFNSLLRMSLILLPAGALAYSLFLGASSPVLVNLLYGGKYDSQAALLWLLLLMPILDGASVVLANALRSLERPDLVFWSQFAVALFVMTVGIVATRSSGLWGAASGIVFANLIGAIILAGGVLRELRLRNPAIAVADPFIAREAAS